MFVLERIKWFCVVGIAFFHLKDDVLLLFYIKYYQTVGAHERLMSEK